VPPSALASPFNRFLALHSTAFPFVSPNRLPAGTRATPAFYFKSYPNPRTSRRCKPSAPPPKTLLPPPAHLSIPNNPKPPPPPPPAPWLSRLHATHPSAPTAAAIYPRSSPRTSGSLRCGTACPSSPACVFCITCRQCSLPCRRPPRHLLLLTCVGQPHVLRFCDERGVRDEASVVAFLKSTTMVRRLLTHCFEVRRCASRCCCAGRPAASAAPHTRSQVPRQLQHAGARASPSPAALQSSQPCCKVWLTTYIWGIIYLRNQDPLLFDSACVRLFKISFAD
jgi:hypothetical protein